jgi:Flp pilus assembly protein TadB
MPTSEQQFKSNGAIALLAKLAQSGHAWVQFGILVLVGLSGLGNWVATWNSANRNKEEIEVNRRVAWEGEQRIRDDVRRQVEEMHRWMTDATKEFHQGNQDSAANRKMLEELIKKDKQ